MFGAQFSDAGGSHLRDATDLSSSSSDEDEMDDKIIDNTANPSIGVGGGVPSKKNVAPLVPPRRKELTLALNINSLEETPTWFVVMSPREIRGVAGPFSLDQMRKMYKYQEFNDSSLLWQEGQKNWMTLNTLHSLRTQLLQLPTIPLKITKDADVFVPSIDSYTKNSIVDIKSIKPLSSWELNNACQRCGTNAVAYDQNFKSGKVYDLSELRVDSGSTNAASEVVPSFLYVGDKKSYKNTAIAELKATLIINCTEDLKNPIARIPYFRCQQIPFKEAPVESQQSNVSDVANVLEMLERVYDWIEMERILPERAVESDPVPGYYRGKTDKFGRPLEKSLPLVRIEKGTKEMFKSRVLLYGKKGNDRPCLVAMAFLAKHYGMTKSYAMEVMLKARPHVSLSPLYEAALDKWCTKYSMGELFCLDCIEMAKKPPAQSIHDMYKTLDDICAGDVRLKDLLPSNNFLKQVYTGTASSSSASSDTVMPLQQSIQQERTSGLIDLQLPGQRVNDDMMQTLVSALYSVGSLHQLRILVLRDNCICSLGLQSLSNGLMNLVSIGNNNNNSSADTDDRSSKKSSSKSKSKSKDWKHGELLVFDISNNNVGDADSGLASFSTFLSKHMSITSLDLSNNSIGDYAGSYVFQSLTKETSDLYEDPTFGDDDDDDGSTSTVGSTRSTAGKRYTKSNRKSSSSSSSSSKSSKYKKKAFNKTLTSLSMHSNSLGIEACTALNSMVRVNSTLTYLNLDHNEQIQGKIVRNIMDSLRIYNTSLHHLSLCDVPATVKITESILKMLSGNTNPVETLQLSRCEVSSLHMASLKKWSSSIQYVSKYLTCLDISSNPIGDTGAEYLSIAIRGMQYDGHLYPPIRKLDVSTCSIDVAGCKEIVKACASRSSVTHLDISNNSMQSFELDDEFVAALQACNFITLYASGCSIKSNGCIKLLSLLSVHNIDTVYNVNRCIGTSKAYDDDAVTYIYDNTKNSNSNYSSTNWNSRNDFGNVHLSRSLRSLSLANNDIHDRAAPYFAALIEKNITIRSIDLGFNAFTDASATDFKNAMLVTSTSTDEKKLYDLNINMIGNKCSSYIFGTPGMSRSKINFRFGTTGLNDHGGYSGSTRSSYDHIQTMSLRHFIMRKENDEKYSDTITENKIRINQAAL